MESECQVDSLYLLFPYAKMDLKQWLHLSKPPQDWRDVDNRVLKDYIYGSMKSLCDAVAYLHKVIEGSISSHHDLKPANILLFGKDWKIADFGRTHLIRLSAGSDTEGASGLGTYMYHPPEYWDSSGRRASVRHGRAFDIWALGCIIVEFATIAVHGWSTKSLWQFYEKRRANTASSNRLTDRGDSDDDSYHNNMNVVKD